MGFSTMFDGNGERLAWGIPSDWLTNEIRVSGANVVVFEIVGNAMSPTLEPGDRVIIDRSSRDPRVDAIYAILDGGSVIIRYVQLVRSEGPVRIRCLCTNPIFEPIELVIGAGIEILGRVAGRISRM